MVLIFPVFPDNKVFIHKTVEASQVLQNISAPRVLMNFLTLNLFQINIWNSLCLTAKCLPRSFSQACAIPFKLKRRIGDVGDYAYETISPHKVHVALDYLTGQEAYKEEGITHSEKYGQYGPDESIPFTLGNKDLNEEDPETEDKNSSSNEG